MRLIDADAMIETLNRKYPQWYTGKPKDSLKHYAWLVYYWAVREAPTIDAVPVVRCKDCWRYEPFDDCKPYDCEYSGMYRVHKDDYCSKGERK